MKVGCVVGRFQVSDLHEGHKFFLDTVSDNCDQLVIFIGTSRAVSNRKNPLDFMTRYNMLVDEYPEAVIWCIEDEASDFVWSNKLDSMLRPFGHDVTLYGSRDSFIPHYYGCFKKEIIESDFPALCATNKREAITVPRSSEDFRAGVIYHQNTQRPKIFNTVDIAVVHKDKLLLGKKEKESKWRLPGGFVDIDDLSLEAAACRELREETTLNYGISEFKYVSSHVLNDWRYLEENKILTSLFLVQGDSEHGHPMAADDLELLEYRDMSKISLEYIVPTHHVLISKIMTKLKLTPSVA